MTQILEKNNSSKWISLAEAASYTPYSAEYLSLLARKERIVAKKINGIWYTTRLILEDYLEQQASRAELLNRNADIYSTFLSKAKNSSPEESITPIETATETVTPSTSQTEHSTEAESEELAISFMRKLNTHIDKEIEAHEGIVHKSTRFIGRSYATVFSSKKLAAGFLILTLLFTVLPVRYVSGFVDNLFRGAVESVRNAQTVMGFRPGTHEDEILLLGPKGEISIFGTIETEGQFKSLVEQGVAPIVVNSTTKVENFNADQLDGNSAENFTLAFVTKNGNVTYEPVELNGKVEIGSTLLVRGATKLLNHLAVDGGISVIGDAVFNNDLKVHGNGYFDNLIKAPEIIAQQVLRSQGDLSIDGVSTFRDRATFEDGLTAGGSRFTGSTAVDASFYARRDVRLGSDGYDVVVRSSYWDVDNQGNANFESLDIADDFTVDGQLSVSGALTATTGTFSGAIAALSATITNAFSAASATITGLLTTGSLTVTNTATTTNLSILGTLRDGNSVAGGVGQVLSSTGTSTDWVDTSSLSVGNAGTLDALDSLQFLRSDTSDSYTSGTLTFDVGTTVNVAGTLGITGISTLATTTITNATISGNQTIGGTLGVTGTTTAASFTGAGTGLTGTAAGLTAGNVTTNANLTGAVTSVGNATALGSFTSANLAAALTNETGTGNAVFSASPTLTGTLTAGNANFSGSVGIGTIYPYSGTKLTLSGGGMAVWANNSQLGTLIDMSGGSHGYAAGVGLTIDSSGSSDIMRMRSSGGATLNVVNSAGNIGIGDATPVAPLTVGNGDRFQVNSSGAIAAATGITSSGAVTLSNLAGGGFLTTNGSGVLSTTTISSSDLPLTNGYVFRGGVSNTAEATSTLFIADSGNVGIGNISPSYQLDVAGSTLIRSILSVADTTVKTYSSFGSNSTTHSLSGGQDVLISGNLEVDGDIFSDGGSISFSQASTTGDLEVGGVITLSDGSALNPAFTFTGDNDTGIFRPNTNVLAFTTAGSERITILANGNVGIGDTTPASLFTVGNGDLFQVNSSGDIITQSVGVDALESEDFGSFTCNGTTCTVDTGAISNAMLANSAVSYGGVSVSLGAADATPAFNLVDATGLPVATGISGLGTGMATFLATPSSANLATTVTDETGTGALVFGTSPTLVTPNLGTPSTLIGTNITGTGASFTAGNATKLATPRTIAGVAFDGSANISLNNNAITNGAGYTTNTGTVTSVSGSGGTTGLTLTGGAITTSGTLTLGGTLAVANGGTGATTAVTARTALGLAIGSDIQAYSANTTLLGNTTTGSGSIVLATSPTLVTPNLGTPSTLVGTNITGTASGLTAGNVTTNANLTGMVTSVGNAASLGSFTSANLAGALTNETGTGNAVFSASPTFTGTINAAAATLSSTLTLSGTAANIALGSNYLSGDGGDEGVFVDGSGNVGIGTTAPTQQLDIRSAGDTYIRIHSSDNAGKAGLKFQGAGDRGSIFGEGDYDIVVEPNALYGEANFIIYPKNGLTTLLGILDNTPDFGIESAASTTNGYFALSSSENADGDIFVVDENGNAGIGTSNPLASLQVAGGTPFAPDTSGSNPFVGLRVGSPGFGVALDMGTQPNVSPTYSWIQSRSSTNNAFNNNLVLQQNGGNVGIGTTGPSEKLHVIGNGLFSGTVTASSFTGAGTGLTGTGASFTAGNVTTNANLTGMVTSVGNAASLGSFTSANLSGALTNETGSGAAVFGTSPALSNPTVTCTGCITDTNVSDTLTSSVLTSLGNYVLSSSTTAMNLPLGITNSFVSGTDGFPNYGTVINARGYINGGGGGVQIYAPYGSANGGSQLRFRLADYSVNTSDPPWTGWKTIWDDTSDGVGSGLDADLLDGLSSASFSSAFSNSAGLAALLSDETGSGALVFGTSPTLSGTVTGGTFSGGTWQGNAIGDAYLTKTGDWTGTLDGYNTAGASTGNTIAVRDGSGDINARLFRSEYDATNPTIGYIMTQIDTATNNYMRPSTPAQLAAGIYAPLESYLVTGVTAGNGLTGGGTSGTATLTVGTGTCITVAATTVGVTSNCTDAATLDSLNSTQFLRSDSVSTLSGNITLISGAGGQTFAANHYSMGVDIANGSWTSPNYSDFIIGYHTGIRIGASYSGVRFYNNSPTTDANNDGNGDGVETLLMTVGGFAGGTGVLVANTLTAGSFTGPGTGLTGTAASLTAGNASNAALLDSIDSSQFLRSDVDDVLTASIIVPTGSRNEGIIGTYDAGKTQQIWSMGAAYRNAADGTSFGNLYGLSYKYNGSAGGHGVYLTQNGIANVGLGSNLWTSGQFIGAGTGLTGTASGLTAGALTNMNISQFTNNSGYITDGNTNWDNSYGYITSTNPFYNVTSGNGNGLCFWTDCTNYTISMGNNQANYGSVTDYSMHFNMGASAGRGFTWGSSKTAVSASLNALNGNFATAGTVTVNGTGYFAGNVQVDGAIVAPEGTLRDDGGGWMRTYGNTGWYSQTYGGGWYMTDATYVRTYGNKPIYVGGANSYFAGDVGIGVSDPIARLEVFETVAGAQFLISYDATRYAAFQVNSTGDLVIDAQGGDVGMFDENLFVCAGGACASTPAGTGNVTAEGSIVSEEFTLGTVGSIAVNMDNGNQQRVNSSTGNMTFTFSNPTAGQTIRLMVCYGGVHTVTWGSVIKWQGGTAPTPTSTSGKCDIFSFVYSGAAYYGAASLNF